MKEVEKLRELYIVKEKKWFSPEPFEARMEITEKYHLSRVGRYAYRKSKKGNALFEVRSRCSFANYIVSLRQNTLSYGR